VDVSAYQIAPRASRSSPDCRAGQGDQGRALQPLGADVLTLSNGMVGLGEVHRLQERPDPRRAYAIGGLATTTPRASYPSAEIATDVVSQSGVAV
jgi:hypothetical protein